jgi:hypothetical protein
LAQSTLTHFHIPPRPRWRGFSFALHLLRVQGFYFYPATIQPHTSVYSGLSVTHAIILPQSQNRLQSFAAAFPLICPIPAHAMQQPHKTTIHHLRHAGGHTVKRSTSTDTKYQRHAGRCTAQHSRPIIIRYIRARPCYGFMPDGAAYRRPCKPGGVCVSTCTGSSRRRLDASHARRITIWHRVSSTGSTLHPAGQTSGRDTAGGAEPMAALAASLFGLSPDSQ